MTNRYKLQTGPDGLIWVPIQPLMEDVKEACYKLEALDQHLYDQMNSDEKEIYMLKIKGLDTIYSFLGSLKIEHELQSMSDRDKTLYNINDEINKATLSNIEIINTVH
jgi:hypothetical protein